MKIEISKEEDIHLQFVLEGTSTHFANAIRRYAMNAVPVYALDEVTIYENTSTLFDEYLAHRLGLIPIITPPNAPADSEIIFYLDAKGPKVVYASELESKDKEVKVAREKIPIITLGENQQIRLEAKAKLGTARKHAKFQAGLAAYEIAGDSYKFIVESFSQMSPRELILRAATALENDVEELSKQLSKIKKK